MILRGYWGKIRTEVKMKIAKKMKIVTMILDIQCGKNA